MDKLINIITVVVAIVTVLLNNAFAESDISGTAIYYHIASNNKTVSDDECRQAYTMSRRLTYSPSGKLSSGGEGEYLATRALKHLGHHPHYLSLYQVQHDQKIAGKDYKVNTVLAVVCKGKMDECTGVFHNKNCHGSFSFHKDPSRTVKQLNGYAK